MKRKQHGALDPHALIEQNIALVPMLVKKFANRIVSMDDMLLVGFIGLTKAANSFATSNQADFSTHTKHCIERELLAYIKKRYIGGRT